MLRKLICAGSAMAVMLCFTVGAQAKTVSINFTDGSVLLGASDVAGYYADDNWYNATVNNGTVDGTTLLDGDGLASGVTAQWDTLGSRNSNVPTGGSAADQILFSYGRETGINKNEQRATQVALQGLNAAFADGYDVIFYFGDSGLTNQSGQGDAWRSTVLSDYQIGTGSSEPNLPGSSGTIIVPGNQVGQPEGAVFNGTYTFGANGNSLLDVNLSDDTLVYSFRSLAGGSSFEAIQLVGMQIVGDGPAVPEPSTFALAGLGLIGLVGYGLRRRKK